MLKTLSVMRYVTPLREGGSLPAVVEAEDGESYVIKFRGAGQGPKALVAELIVGEIARHLGLNVPELALIELDARIGRAEPHQEIRDLLMASVGLNLAMGFLSSAFAYNPLLPAVVDAKLAAQIVWLDAYTLNVDRTARNTNLLIWQKQLWLIDHGAALYFQHDWPQAAPKITSPFAPIRQHVLLPLIDSSQTLQEVDVAFRHQLRDEVLHEIVELVPSTWLAGEKFFADEAAHRAGYVDLLSKRRDRSSHFVEEAIRVLAKA